MPGLLEQAHKCQFRFRRHTGKDICRQHPVTQGEIRRLRVETSQIIAFDHGEIAQS